MGWFDWFKGKGPTGGVDPSDASDAGDAQIEWLVRKLAEHRCPKNVETLPAAEVLARVSALANATPAFQRGAGAWAFGMVLPDSTGQEYVGLAHLAERQLDGWERGLEAIHGEMGLSLFAEGVGDAVPHRGKPRHPLRRGTLDLTEPTVAELAAIDEKAANVAVERTDGRLAARVDGGDFAPGTVEALEATLLEHGAELQALTLGLFPEGDYTEAWGILVEHGPYPKLRDLWMDFDYPEEVEISWTTLGNFDRAWAALPALRKLRLRGGGLVLVEPGHDTLEELTIESGGVPAESVLALTSAVSEGRFPKLRSLSLWAGTPDYGGDAGVEHFAPLWAAQPPAALVRLGLMNTELSDALVAPLVASPLARQLVELSFTMGTLTDAGVEQLIAAREAFPKLRQLDLSENFVTDELCERVRAAFEGVEVCMTTSKEPDYFDDEVSVYVSVSE